MNKYIEQHFGNLQEIQNISKHKLSVRLCVASIIAVPLFLQTIYDLMLFDDLRQIAIECVLLLALGIPTVYGIVKRKQIQQKAFSRRLLKEVSQAKGTVLPLAAKIELECCSLRDRDAKEKKSTNKKSIPSGSASVLDVANEIEKTLNNERKNNGVRMVNAYIPEYSLYPADFLFSFESFGKDSKKIFKMLKKYLCSEERAYSLYDVEEFSKMQNVYSLLKNRLSAYHRSRYEFDELQETEKTSTKFEEILRQATEAEKNDSIKVDLISERESLHKPKQNNKEYVSIDEYAEKLFKKA